MAQNSQITFETEVSTETQSEIEEHHGHEEHSLSLVQLKVLFLLLILIAALAAFLPLKLAKLKPNTPALGYLNCVAAGLFLCIAILHMLPESVEAYHSWVEHEGIEKPFNLPYLCVFFGYMLVLLVDKVLVEAIVKRVAQKNTPIILHAVKEQNEAPAGKVSA